MSQLPTAKSIMDCVDSAINATKREEMYAYKEAAALAIEQLEREAHAKQAHIDRLMLEYCPDEMTPEQVEEWGRHQRAVPDSLPARSGSE